MLKTLTRSQKVAALFLIVLLGLVLRLRGLGQAGFNEDEVHKVEAARGYLRGNFSANLEHPMLMKSMIAVSLAATDTWNRKLGGPRQVTEEVAVRLPNAIFGALTAVVLFLLAQELFGVEIGLLTAFLWSIGTLAIMDNRLAKEDTLLVFFTWLAYYFYLRAKSAATKDPQRAAKYYGISGASFGLMLASKYFPHYLGLNCLYHYLAGKKTQPAAPLRQRDVILLLGACALLFVLFNPLILLPNTLRYMLHYAGEGTMTHHGYLMMGRFYYNDPAHLRGGMPIYFYPLLLAIKTPLLVMGAFLVGLIEVWRRRREPGPSFILFMFPFWIVPFSLLSAKWLRYMLAWMPTVTMIAAIGLAKILSWSTVLAKRPTRGRLAPALAGVLAAIFLLEPAWVSAKSGPYYSLYLNPLGRGRVGYYFPHDEVNDMGLREAIQQICERASQRAMVGGETQPVFNYYFHQFGRDDLRYFDLSDPVKRVEAPPSAYLVVQDGRKYFENISFIQRVESYQSPVRTVDVGGAHAVRIYQDQEFAQLRMDR
jgi:4-amino-4-deoxy-L-arabinose transferase-like glycosyltransferase